MDKYTLYWFTSHTEWLPLLTENVDNIPDLVLSPLRYESGKAERSIFLKWCTKAHSLFALFIK